MPVTKGLRGSLAQYAGLQACILAREPGSVCQITGLHPGSYRA